MLVCFFCKELIVDKSAYFPEVCHLCGEEFRKEYSKLKMEDFIDIRTKENLMDKYLFYGVDTNRTGFVRFRNSKRKKLSTYHAPTVSVYS